MLIFCCRLLKINDFFAKKRKCSLLSYHYRDSRGHHATCKSTGNTQEERAENHLHIYIFCYACWKGLLRLNGKVHCKFLILIVSLTCFTIEISPILIELSSTRWHQMQHIVSEMSILFSSFCFMNIYTFLNLEIFKPIKDDSS